MIHGVCQEISFGIFGFWPSARYTGGRGSIRAPHLSRTCSARVSWPRRLGTVGLPAWRPGNLRSAPRRGRRPAPSKVSEAQEARTSATPGRRRLRLRHPGPVLPSRTWPRATLSEALSLGCALALTRPSGTLSQGERGYEWA